MTLGHRNHVETHAALLHRAIWLLDRARLRLNLLIDITGEQKINRIIHSVETERQHWLRAVDSPLL